MNDIQRFYKNAAIIASIFLSIVIIGIFTYIYMINPYTWQECDWNDDGSTTIAEWIEGINIGKFDLSQGELKCQQYFRLKDAANILIRCPKQSISNSSDMEKFLHEHSFKIQYKSSNH